MLLWTFCNEAVSSTRLSVFLCVCGADAEAKEVVNYFAVATPFVFLIALFVVWINSEASFFLCYHTIKRFCRSVGAESETERETPKRERQCIMCRRSRF
jgi:hypothetical protein